MNQSLSTESTAILLDEMSITWNYVFKPLVNLFTVLLVANETDSTYCLRHFQTFCRFYFSTTRCSSQIRCTSQITNGGKRKWGLNDWKENEDWIIGCSLRALQKSVCKVILNRNVFSVRIAQYRQCQLRSTLEICVENVEYKGRCSAPETFLMGDFLHESDSHEFILHLQYHVQNWITKYLLFFNLISRKAVFHLKLALNCRSLVQVLNLIDISDINYFIKINRHSSRFSLFHHIDQELFED